MDLYILTLGLNRAVIRADDRDKAIDLLNQSLKSKGIEVPVRLDSIGILESYGPPEIITSNIN